jgi:hypothetical protein
MSTGGTAGTGGCTNTCTNGATACLTTSSTQIQSCGLGTNGCTTETTSACGTNLVCERAGSAACVDPNWAEWQPPNYTYTDNGDGTVTDKVTALVWQQTNAADKKTQADAFAYCSSLTLGGYKDWRLPTVIELASLLTPGVYSPNVNTAYFPNNPSDWFWSSTAYAGQSGYGWDVDFGLGNTYWVDVTSTQYVRCVR